MFNMLHHYAIQLHFSLYSLLDLVAVPCNRLLPSNPHGKLGTGIMLDIRPDTLPSFQYCGVIYDIWLNVLVVLCSIISAHEMLPVQSDYSLGTYCCIMNNSTAVIWLQTRSGHVNAIGNQSRSDIRYNWTLASTILLSYKQAITSNRFSGHNMAICLLMFPLKWILKKSHIHFIQQNKSGIIFLTFHLSRKVFLF